TPAVNPSAILTLVDTVPRTSRAPSPSPLFTLTPQNRMLMTRTLLKFRQVFPIAAIMFILHAAPGPAQYAPAFPGEVLTAYLSGDVDRVWASANSTMREMWGSPAGLAEGMTEIASMMGPETGR